MAELISDCAIELEPVLQDLKVQLVIDADNALTIRADASAWPLLIASSPNTAERSPQQTPPDSGAVFTIVLPQINAD